MRDAEISDANLIRAVTRGDRAAFLALYRKHRDDVYRFAYGLSRSGDVAEDVTQDVFVNMLQRASSFEPSKGSVRAWLFGCARNLMLGELNRQRRWGRSALDPDEQEGSSNPHNELVTERRAKSLHAAISGLPFQYREVIVLCELQELSYAEAASIMSCPIGTVRSRLHRARRLLLSRLSTTREELRREWRCAE